MRVVSGRSEAEIQAHEAELRTQEAEAKVKYALRRLAANIMRVTRGAGSSAELGHQMVACIEAMEAYRDVVGTWVPSWDLNQMLDPDKAQAEFRPWARQDEVSMARWEAEGTLDCEDAERDVRRACLRIAASMLVNQLPQMNRGETDLSEAIERREAARERRRAYFQAQLTPAPRTQKKPKPR